MPRAISNRAVLVCFLTGAVYLLVVLAIAVVEHYSEMSKIDRGFFSDTFPPTAFTQLATLPLSLWAADFVPSYPDRFDGQAFRHVVGVRHGVFVLAGAVQAAAPGLVAAAATALPRR